MKPLKPIALVTLLTASIALPLFAQSPMPQQPPRSDPNNRTPMKQQRQTDMPTPNGTGTPTEIPMASETE